jgi:hypothetical protein
MCPVPEIEPEIRNLKPSGSLTNVGALVLGLGSPHEEKLGRKVYVDYDNVPIETIDSLGLERLDLIKIDAQGFEAKVLKGGAKTIKKYLPDVYMEYGACSVKIIQRCDCAAILALVRMTETCGSLFSRLSVPTDVQIHPLRDAKSRSLPFAEVHIRRLQVLSPPPTIVQGVKFQQVG